MQRLRDRMQRQHQVVLTWDNAAVQHVVDACDTAEAGARRMGNYIDQHLLPPLADFWLEAMRERRPPQAIHVFHVPGCGTPFSFNPLQPEKEAT
jgi:ATP-dependent Clp protease ATP-binding subunit ClpA